MRGKFFLIFASCVVPFRALATTSAAQGVTTLTSIPLVQSCSSVSSIQEAQEECFTRVGLKVELPTLSLSDSRQIKQSYLDAVMNDNITFQETCSELDRYQGAVTCAMRVPLQCLTTDYWDYFPSADNIRSMMSMLCDNINVSDVDCLKSVAADLFDCGYNKGVSYVRDMTSQGISVTTKDILCYAPVASAECQLKVLPTCGCQTTRIYVQASKLYLNPPACSPVPVITPDCQPGTGVLPFRALATTSAAQGVTTLTSIPLVQSCSSVSSIQEAQEECFTRVGLKVELPTLSLSDSRQIKQSYLDAIVNDKITFQKFCSELDRYQGAVTCAMRVPLQCLTTDYWDYFPSADNIRSMMAMLCENINVIDIDCVKSVSADLFDCGYNKGVSYVRDMTSQGISVTTKGILCYAFVASAECQLKVLPACGCQTARIYVQTSKLYLNPPACSPVPVVTPDCQPRTETPAWDTETQQFIDSGAAMLKMMPLLVLSALVLFALRGSTLMI